MPGNAAWQFNLRHLLAATAVLALLIWLFSRWLILGLVGVLLVGIVLGQSGSNRRNAVHSRIGWLIAGISLIAIVVMVLQVHGNVALGVGQTTLTVDFLVTDSQTSQPVAGALVRLRDHKSARVPTTDIPGGEEGVEGITDAKGRCALAYQFTFTDRSGPGVSYEAHARLDHYVQVEAPGYEVELVPLFELVRSSCDMRTHKLPQVAHIPVKKKVEVDPDGAPEHGRLR